MIRISGGARRLCDGRSRRELLRLGGLSLLGLSLPELLARSAAASPGAPRLGRAKSCILFFQEGGLAQQDSWDLKPESPIEVRGPFGAIRTSTGERICEHMPELAKVAHRYALIRSVTHDIFDHNAGAYYCLTGRSPRTGSGLVQGDRRTNFPGYGAVASRLRPPESAAPGFAHIPALLTNNGEFLPGQKAGFLGGQYDPFVLGDPTQPEFAVPGLTAPGRFSSDRLARREALLRHVGDDLAQLSDLPLGRDTDAYYDRAFRILTSGETRKACDLTAERTSLRERYGMHHMGQSFLLARRLVEAGVRLVTVTWGPNSGSDSNQCWDTHRRNHHFLQNSLLPPTDRGLAALISDLHDRGLLEETLVVAMGEFGRTPEINKQGGRDHWPHCYSIMLAGGGIRGGAIYGASDEHAAYPARDPVTPEDVAATIYAALGIDPAAEILDLEARPHAVALGQPVRALFG
jgi:hypothetical protein